MIYAEDLPEGYLEEFKKWSLWYFEDGLLPSHLTDTDIKQHALRVYRETLELEGKEGLKDLDIPNLAFNAMMIADFKKGWFGERGNLTDLGEYTEGEVAGNLPEGYLEEFEKGVRDYFNGVVPPFVTYTDLKTAAWKLYQEVSERQGPPRLEDFSVIADTTMLVVDLKKAGFDSLNTWRKIRRAFRSRKFRLYLREVRQQGRLAMQELDRRNAAYSERLRRREQKKKEKARIRAQDEKRLAEIDQRRAEIAEQLAENARERARNDEILAKNRKAKEDRRRAVQFVKSKLEPDLAAAYEEMLVVALEEEIERVKQEFRPDKAAMIVAELEEEIAEVKKPVQPEIVAGFVAEFKASRAK